MERDIVERLQDILNDEKTTMTVVDMETVEGAILEICRLRAPPALSIGVGTHSIRLDQQSYILTVLAPGEVEKIAEKVTQFLRSD